MKSTGNGEKCVLFVAKIVKIKTCPNGEQQSAHRTRTLQVCNEAENCEIVLEKGQVSIPIWM